jgi:hypothetical protein
MVFQLCTLVSLTALFVIVWAQGRRIERLERESGPISVSFSRGEPLEIPPRREP